jgi:hypothetical protein
MKHYTKIFLCLGLIITLTFFVFCISQAKSETVDNYNSREPQEQIQQRQEQIKERLDRIERKMKKREKRRSKRRKHNGQYRKN